MSSSVAAASVLLFLSKITGRQDLTLETDLQEHAILDSLMMMDLLVHIESEFNVRLDFADLTPETFRSADTIGKLIESRRGRVSSFAA